MGLNLKKISLKGWLLILGAILFLPYLIKVVFTKFRTITFIPYYVNPLNTSISSSKAQTIANSHYNAMKDWGTDEDTLFSSLEKLTSDDLKLIYNSFGYKKYWLGLGSNNKLDDLVMYKYDLIEWYKKELTKRQYLKMKNIWSNTGISNL